MSYTATCHCKAVSVTITELPEFVQDCNCSLCRKNGSLWGYFPSDQVKISSQTQSYFRQDRSNPAVQIHFCGNCGSASHWSLTQEFIKQNGPNKRMGVNMNLFDPDVLTGLELRFADGLNWDGEGPFNYRKSPEVFGD